MTSLATAAVVHACQILITDLTIYIAAVWARNSYIAFRFQGPTASGLLEGRWRLLVTTPPGSAYPIQKALVGVDAFTVYQEVLDSAGQGRVNNIVDFGPKVGALKAGQLAVI